MYLVYMCVYILYIVYVYISNAHILCKQVIQNPTCLKGRIKGDYKEQVCFLSALPWIVSPASPNVHTAPERAATLGSGEPWKVWD